MLVPVCYRPSVAESTEAQDRSFMETKSAAIHRKMPMPARQLSITGFAHKAGVVGDADRAAIVTLFDMTAKRRRAARRDGAHDAAFATAQMAGVILAKSLAMAAKDIRQLDRLRHGPPQAGGMTSTSNPSSGLFVLPMVCVETCV